ncbi:hypothetical protein AJ79_04245 [Helicocarpus griseus UAMH5409]|uniref:Acyltransferase 3 domain-containing protein n=1 Tax=Helicocarpus griseus UAMH5409 TaxID=1447875 RepID=A0A2B7XUQ4_9EURO|nr:hypothetical protein AJ79_04245 [Helicocarpus griseus UAMH5409]
MVERDALPRAYDAPSASARSPVPFDHKLTSRSNSPNSFTAAPLSNGHHHHHPHHPDQDYDYADSDTDSDSLEERSMRLLSRFYTTIIPSFLQEWVIPGSEHLAPQKLHSIAALDGLRGWACLLVFNFHFLFTYTDKTAVGWGFGEGNWGLHQLPIIHMLISGHVMVTIFFVISGYVLSYKPLKLLRSHSWEQAFHTLASSTFRRGFRLYVPSIIGTICVFIGVRLGFYDYSTWVRDEGHTILGINEQHPPLYVYFKDQFRDWWFTIIHLMDPWNWQLYYNFYNPHLWTIPVEFRCSMVLFLTIIFVSRLRVWIRLAFVSYLLVFCIRWGRWDVVLFMAGMLMAEIDIMHGLWEQPSPPVRSSSIPLRNMDRHDEDSNNARYNGHASSSNSNPNNIINPDDIEKAHYHPPAATAPWTTRRIFWLVVFVIGLFIGSSPNSSPGKTPFYSTLARALTPKTYPEPHRFLQSLGAIIIVTSINHSKDLQKLFTNDLAQYLGRISYALYIVHGPILHSLGYSLMPSIWALTGKETDAQYCSGFLIGWCICLPVSIWAADVFWRTIDVPSVKFARWLERKVIVAGL